MCPCPVLKTAGGGSVVDTRMAGAAGLKCGFAEFSSINCGFLNDTNTVPLKSCTKDVRNHLSRVKVASNDVGIDMFESWFV